MLFNGAFSSDGFTKEVVVHELGHVWDFLSGFNLSDDLVILTKPYKKVCAIGDCTMVWDPNSAVERFTTKYAKENKREYCGRIVHGIRDPKQWQFRTQSSQIMLNKNTIYQ